MRNSRDCKLTSIAARQIILKIYRMELQHCVLQEGCSGIVHPMYEHDELKWVVMSIPKEHCETTGLASLAK